MNVLVAGIGNIFLADDGFGVEVVRRLAERPLPEGVQVVDFGIRGMDLAYALMDNHDAVIFVDAAPRGGEPGTLYLIEPRVDGEAEIDTHGMDPVKVLRLARELGAEPRRILVVACEPKVVMNGQAGAPDVVVELSEPVHAAVDEAVVMVESLVQDIVREEAPVKAAAEAIQNKADRAHEGVRQEVPVKGGDAR